MPGFVPHLSNLELIRQAGIFYPRITDLTGKLCTRIIQILISNYFTSTFPINNIVVNRSRLRIYLHLQFPYMIKEKMYLHIIPSFSQSNRRNSRDGPKSYWSSNRTFYSLSFESTCQQTLMIQFVNIKLFEHCVLFNEISKRFAKGRKMGAEKG